MNHNPNECDIVQDLLPLYYDHACSPASCELVRQHLADCADCEKIYEDLANHTIDNVIETESCEILERHAKKERNLAYKAGIVIAALLLVPILITFIVSMAGGSGLGVFSVVTASMMLVAALTVVPLISSQKRLMKCILCGVGALLLILFFVNAMNGGMSSGEVASLRLIPFFFIFSIIAICLSESRSWGSLLCRELCISCQAIGT